MISHIAVRSPQSAIRNPQSAVPDRGWLCFFSLRFLLRFAWH